MPEVITRIPSRSTIQLWILKFGLHKLKEPKKIAKDWAVILDHTIQMGKSKILIVLGLQLSYLPFNRSLTLGDVQVLSLLPMQSSTGPQIQEVLVNLKNELGSIREVVADEGPDIKLGANLYRENNLECDYINDIVHKLAHFLKGELKNDNSWEKLLKGISETRIKLLQTDYAHLIPPQRRDKARYLNLEKFIKWACRILAAFKNDQLSFKDQKALLEFTWVLDLADDIKDFHQLWQVTSTSRDFVRNYGIQADTAAILSRKLRDLSLDTRARIFADKIIQFLSEQSVKAKSYERLLGSSEIIESAIGLVKHHSNTHSDFTRFILITAALVGKIDEQTVLNSMTSTRVADVKVWEKTYFSSTIKKKQAEFYRKNGTEIGTYFTEDFEPETS
jgi:hypothetical protein